MSRRWIATDSQRVGGTPEVRRNPEPRGMRPVGKKGSTMLSLHAARDRAIRMAVATGEMADFHLIHNIQKSEGFEACFGRAKTACSETKCRWHRQCMALARFELEPREAEKPAVAAVQGPRFRSPREYREGTGFLDASRRSTERRRPPSGNRLQEQEVSDNSRETVGV